MSAVSAPRYGPESDSILPSGLLLTDLYQLIMVQAYLDRGMREPAVFEFFVRKLPETWGFLVAAGLEQALDFLETARFTETELLWLAESGRFKDDTLNYLAALRFIGDVDAMPEGTVFFPDEPILRVIATSTAATFSNKPARPFWPNGVSCRPESTAVSHFGGWFALDRQHSLLRQPR